MPNYRCFPVFLLAIICGMINIQQTNGGFIIGDYYQALADCFEPNNMSNIPKMVNSINNWLNYFDNNDITFCVGQNECYYNKIDLSSYMTSFIMNVAENIKGIPQKVSFDHSVSKQDNQDLFADIKIIFDSSQCQV